MEFLSLGRRRLSYKTSLTERRGTIRGGCICMVVSQPLLQLFLLAIRGGEGVISAFVQERSELRFSGLGLGPPPPPPPPLLLIIFAQSLKNQLVCENAFVGGKNRTRELLALGCELLHGPSSIEQIIGASVLRQTIKRFLLCNRTDTLQIFFSFWVHALQITEIRKQIAS